MRLSVGISLPFSRQRSAVVARRRQRALQARLQRAPAVGMKLTPRHSRCGGLVTPSPASHVSVARERVYQYSPQEMMVNGIEHSAKD